jgi:PIN domain nuclease of toxin-antitoxin system
MMDSGLVVLDTHVWVWWASQDERLPAVLRERIDAAAHVAVSAVSVYELVQAVGRGRLRLTLALDDWLESATVEAKAEIIPVDVRIAKRAAGLPQVHGDPLDRLIIATVLEHGGQLVSQDGKFSGYPELVGVLISQ